MLSFSARIIKLGVNPLVNVPLAVSDKLFSRAGKTKGPVPVKGTLNGKPYLQTMVKYEGALRLHLNTAMRKATGIDVGDIANVQIDFDAEPRITAMNKDLKRALATHKKANEVFKKFSAYRKKEILRYISNLKTEESIKRNIQKIIKHLTGKEKFAGRTAP